LAQYRSDGGREVRARKSGYACANCGGRIYRKELYWNYHTDQPKGNWQGRRHLDCEAAWWQVDKYHLLAAVGKLPGKNPPDIPPFNPPHHVPTLIDFGLTGSVDLAILRAYIARIALAPQRETAEEAVEQIKQAMQLLLDALVAASGNQKKAVQLSHLLQQIAQVTEVSAHPRNYP